MLVCKLIPRNTNVIFKKCVFKASNSKEFSTRNFQVGKLIPFERKKVFDVVKKIEDYPLFLSTCKSVEINPVSARNIDANVTFSHTLVPSKTVLFNVQWDEDETNLVSRAESKHLFEFIELDWNFTEITETSCMTTLTFKAKFFSPLTSKLFDSSAESLKKRVMDAYIGRLESLNQGI